MISINILFPREKKRIKRKVAEKLKEKYNKNVRDFRFTHIGDEKIGLDVFLEDGKPLYITVIFYKGSIIDITIEEDMSY